ncbi:MAG TPA: UvrD-helicase domain-containing protein [Bacteroidales bacterium]|nr:UvrD-helicase domain-containing protein [Bacteroidales bacterium]
MSKLLKINASAGSGKTFRLTREMLLLLTRNPENYKHILAITFTNKAAAEMKSRVLKALLEINTDKGSVHLKALADLNKMPVEAIQKKADEALFNILHNYSLLSVITIDSFFQRVIKSFAREMGFQMNFDIEMDLDSVLVSSAHEMINDLKTGDKLTEWLAELAIKRIEEGKSWSFEDDIVSMGKQLFNEDFKLFSETFHNRIKDRDWLLRYKQLLVQYKKHIEVHTLKMLAVLSADAKRIMDKYQVGADSFKEKSRGIGTFMLSLDKYFVKDLPACVNKYKDDVSLWPQSDKVANSVIAAANAGLEKILKDAVNLIQVKKKSFNSCSLVLDNFYTLGILSELSQKIDDYSKDNNLFLLSNTAYFLHEIIGNNDVPFVYEKMGQMYSHFMIDEFQDTSIIQWNTLKPLIAGSLASGGKSLVVGDLKQSIYRWRNTDWRIMAQKVDEDVKEQGVKEETLDKNYRSDYNIVAFNNSFFFQAAESIQKSLTDEMVSVGFEDNIFKTMIKKAYESNFQLAKNQDKGLVKIDFIDTTEKEVEGEKVKLDFKAESLQLMLADLKLIGEKGSTAILVRTNKEGQEVMDFINENNRLEEDPTKRIAVISDETALLSNSVAVNFILNIFQYYINPVNVINKEELVNNWNIILSEMQANQAKVQWNELSVLLKENEHFRFLLPDRLLEKVIELFQLNQVTSYLPYLQRFYDVVNEYLHRSGSRHLLGFVDYWEEKKSKTSLSLTENQKAVRIITLHKSKGLQFDNVLIPFCNWPMEYKNFDAPLKWVQGDYHLFKAIEHAPVQFSKAMENSYFSKDYYIEKAQFYLDNLNLLYVAFTRPKNNLYLYCEFNESKSYTVSHLVNDVLRNSNNIDGSIFPQVNLQKYWDKENMSQYQIGSYSVPEDKDAESIENIELYNLPVSAIDEHLKSKPLVYDFASQQKASKRLSGNTMHKLFQYIYKAEDIDKAINKLVGEGLISSVDRQIYSERVNSLVMKEPYKDWYCGDWKVYTEAAIVVPKQHEYRPDRVMINGKKAVVVDYKFGFVQKDSYIKQVSDYKQTLLDMGFEHVDAFIWYVSLDKYVMA